MSIFRNVAKYSLIGVAVGCTVVGGWGLWQKYRATHSVEPKIPTEVVTYSTDTPDETPLADACAAHKTASNEPQKIVIESIGVDACIQKVGIDQHRAVAVPTNVHLAGWYTQSAVPGASGASIIDGHVRGRYTSGVFAKLDQVSEGSRIKVQMGDNSWREFTTAKVQQVPAEQAASELFRSTTDNSQLVLITCGGAYDEQAKTYEMRVIVRATLVAKP